jgi:repressor LexA
LGVPVLSFYLHEGEGPHAVVSPAEEKQRRSSELLAKREQLLHQEAELLNATLVPILGRVHAGAPLETFEAPEGYCLWSADAVRGRQIYAVRVVGDSMVDDHIIDGDCVIVDPEGEIRAGKPIIAYVKGEKTLKRWGKVTNGHVVLQPANEVYPVITVPLAEVQILGVVIGVSRNMS